MWRPVLMVNGFIMIVLGLMMLIPAGAMFYYSQKIDTIFIQMSLVAIFLGGSLFFANYEKIQKISVLQGYLITVVTWFLTPFVAALPLWQHAGFENFYDAIFEATAGITATGATILDNVEAQPKSILLWRAMLNGFGGIGIIIFAVALSPFLGTGGMHLFHKENSDTEDKFLPKIRYIANDIIITYILLNILCAVLLKFLGMNSFDALTWAISTLSTGGFSIKNNSIAYYDSALIETVIAVFMILGALPITYFVLIFKRRNLETLTHNAQVNAFLKLLLLYILGLTCYYMYVSHESLLKSFRIVSFNIIAAITTTGIYSSDYVCWGTWSVVVFIILFLHGGCTGSTTGSIKIFRWQVIGAFLRRHMIKALYPHQVVTMKTGDKVIDDDIVFSVFALVLSFLFAIIFFTLIISLMGVDFMTALGAVIGNITGAGTGFNAALGPQGNFSLFSPVIKYILSFIMVIGRLEVITVFILFSKIRLR